MALTEISIIESINVKDTNHIEVRRKDSVLRDGVEISFTYHRHVLTQGDDLSNEDPRVKVVANSVWV